MKILFLIESFRAGGKERRLASLIKNLVCRDNVNIEIVLFSDEIHYDLPEKLKFKTHIIKRRFKKDLFSIFKVCLICNKFKPDIVNPWGVMPAFYAVFLKAIFNVKLLNNHITDAPSKIKFFIYYFNLIFSDIIISNSKAGIESYKVSHKKSIIIPNGFDFKRLKNLTNSKLIRKEFNLPQGLIIGMVATFSEFKDYTTFIQSAELILSKYNNITFVCIGDGNSSDYSNRIKKENSNSIIFLGKQKKIESLINVFDIGVLSTFTEGISNSIMEDMALSKPVVATIGGGTSELVENKKSGFLVDEKDSIMMTTYLEILINDSALRKRMGLAGKNIIKSKFDYNLMCDSFYNTFKIYTL